MTTSSGDAGSAQVRPETTESPYGIGVVPDDDAAATGPKPLDPDLEDEQVTGEA